MPHQIEKSVTFVKVLKVLHSDGVILTIDTSLNDLENSEKFLVVCI